MDAMYEVFQGWQKELEHEQDFWGLRYIQPGDGGLIWRNAAACDYFQQFGFFPAPTAPWQGVKQWLGPVETARLESIYVRAFYRFGEPVAELVRSTAEKIVYVDTVFIAIAGAPFHGLVLTHFELCAVSEVAPAPAARFA